MWGTIREVRYPHLESTDSIRVSEFLDRGQQVTLLWYFASWCWNCNQQISSINEIYEDYNRQELGILGIGVYSPPGELQEFVEEYAVTFPVVVGPTQVKDLQARKQTHHYQLRKATGDQRTWGTPFHLFIDASDSSRVYIGAGELREPELRRFLEVHIRHKGSKCSMNESRIKD